jgi:Flp pilus assembly protein TadG
MLRPRPSQQAASAVAGWARRAGATSVEFAVASLFFFLIIMGIVEIGRGFMVKHLLTHAARQGCRLGVIEGTTSAQITTAVNNTLTSDGISGDGVTVQVNDGSADASTAQSGDEITVKVSVTVDKISWVPGTNYLIGSISSQYTLRRE